MNLLATRNGRRLLFGLLYFVEGAPIGFLWIALPPLLRDSGTADASIDALLSHLALVWAFKFLWSPLVDALRGPRFGLRGWIVASQVVMALGLVPLLWLGEGLSTAVLVPALLAHAFAASLQDASIDALAIASTSEDERGSVNGWMQAGFRVGMALLGGQALVLAKQRGAGTAAAALIGVVAGGLALSLLYRPPGRAREVAGDARVGDSSFGARMRELASSLRAAFAQRSTWLGLLFAATAGAGFERVGLSAARLLSDAGLGRHAVGDFLTLPWTVAIVVGSLVGGLATDRRGPRVAVAATGGLLGAAVLALALALHEGLGADTLRALLFTVALGIGLFTATTYALFMDLTDPRIGATQFSAFMGATNLCESQAARWGGALTAARGYAVSFSVLQLVAFAALLLVPFLRRRERSRSLESAKEAR